ncbi:hypothetical protein GGF46_000967 [Coemansia sp. RSA 552]|nr:hypothetical protein GGF46_000967 [Coemansia sp. RSA 552]
MAKKRSILFIVLLVFAGFISFAGVRYRDELKDRSLTDYDNEAAAGGMLQMLNLGLGDNLWKGDTHVVMGKMANETLRAQLGRRTWYLMHQHLKKHPPKVATRDELEQYLCSMHNVVNKTLKKPMFNCTEVHETYDCEVLPPYSPFELDELDAITLEHAAAATSGCNPPPTPTALLEATAGGRTCMSQLLAPKDNLHITLEGMASTAMTVRLDEAGAYGGLVCIKARFNYPKPSGGGGPQAPVVGSSSKGHEKSNTTTVRFGATLPEHTGGDVHAVCNVTLPNMANLAELMLRLPANSRLCIVPGGSKVFRRLNVAVVSGAVQLVHVDTESMRVAVANGDIEATDVASSRLAEFVAIDGAMRIRNCTTAGAIRISSPGATVSAQRLQAYRISAKCGHGALELNQATAKTISASTGAAAVILKGIKADDLDVQSETGPVCGSWAVSRRLSITAHSAIIQGSLRLGGTAVRARIRTRSWPVQLAVDRSFTGAFDVCSENSIASFGFPQAIFHRRSPHRIQGVVGIGPHSLIVDNANSPTVISMHDDGHASPMIS